MRIKEWPRKAVEKTLEFLSLDVFNVSLDSLLVRGLFEEDVLEVFVHKYLKYMEVIARTGYYYLTFFEYDEFDGIYVFISDDSEIIVELQFDYKVIKQSFFQKMLAKSIKKTAKENPWRWK